MTFSDNWYHVREIAAGIYCIAEPPHVNNFLVLGDERAALIDTGLAVGDISRVVTTITRLPVVVVNLIPVAIRREDVLHFGLVRGGNIRVMPGDSMITSCRLAPGIEARPKPVVVRLRPLARKRGERVGMGTQAPAAIAARKAKESGRRRILAQHCHLHFLRPPDRAPRHAQRVYRRQGQLRL